jgi:hypothetical protein
MQIQRGPVRARLVPVLVIPLLLAAAPAVAVNVMTLSVGVTHSDNIFLRPSDTKVPKTWMIAGLDADWRTRTTRIDSTLVSDLTYHSYSETGLKSELAGRLDGSLTVHIVPGTFNWVSEDDYGEGEVRAADVNSPANRQKINYFSTGPDLFFPLGQRNRVVLQGRWAISNYEISNDDSRRVIGSLGLERRVSSSSILFVSARARRIDLTQLTANNNFTVQDGMLGIRSTGVRTELEADIGYSVLHQNGQSDRAAAGHVNLTRRTSVRSNLALTAGQEITDSGEAFKVGLGLTADDQLTRNAIVANDPLRLRYGGIAWTWTGDRTTFRVQSEGRQERRETTTSLNVNRTAGRASLKYQLSPRFDVSVFGQADHDKFTVTLQNKFEDIVGVGAGWRVGPQFVIGGVFDHRTGDSPVSTATYVENRITITFGYTRVRM